jgi:hypothetical protein
MTSIRARARKHPANGASTTVTLPGILYMGASAPESCANTVFEIPIIGLTGSKLFTGSEERSRRRAR